METSSTIFITFNAYDIYLLSMHLPLYHLCMKDDVVIYYPCAPRDSSVLTFDFSLLLVTVHESRFISSCRHVIAAIDPFISRLIGAQR